MEVIYVYNFNHKYMCVCLCEYLIQFASEAIWVWVFSLW